jgi:hypothetical protein
MPPPHVDIASWFLGVSPAGLGPEVRPEAWSIDECVRRTDEAADARALSEASRRCLRSLVWLWNDHLEEAHVEVQDLRGADAAFVHGIMHRREPDASNARYWFHRVGAHPVFDALPAVVVPVLGSVTTLGRHLIRWGRWDPMAFIDAVSAAQGEVGSADATVLRELQRWEMLTLARHLLGT